MEKLKPLIDITKIKNERNFSVVRDKSMILEAHNLYSIAYITDR